MKIPNGTVAMGGRTVSLARIVSEDSQPMFTNLDDDDKSSKDS